MALKLSYAARSRMWAELVSTSGDRVFVPSEEAFEVGQRVEVTVEAPELEEALTLKATVQGLRPGTDRTPAGVVVNFDAESVVLCSRAERADAVRLTGRVESRADGHLSARLKAPVAAAVEVKNLSHSGLTLHADVALQQGARCNVELTLPDGSSVTVVGEVSWQRPELQLTGIRLEPLEGALRARLAQAIATLQASLTRRTASITVVVADDDPSILDFLNRVISKEGHRVLRADRGDAALELIRKERPAMVFLDVLMPGLDGLEVLKAVRADAMLSRTPVVLLSAMSEVKLAQTVTELGANGYLPKPVQLEVVRALLSKCLAHLL